VLSSALYPKVAEDFFKFREIYGPVDKLSTRHFLVGPKIAEEVRLPLLSPLDSDLNAMSILSVRSDD